MKAPPLVGFCLAFCTAAWAVDDDDWLDRLDAALTAATDNGDVRARLSGTAELEYYSFKQPAPGLIESSRDSLWNPRLVLFLDTQLGPELYAFVQGRVDRGFDPSSNRAEGRLDEYVLRYSPRGDYSLSFQLGKFATVVGNWVSRHQAWDNPFVTAPLPYENPTGIFDAAAAGSPAMLLSWSHVRSAIGEYHNQYRVPIIWGPSYATGAAVAGGLGKFEYAAEVKNASLSSRPQVWDVAQTQWQHPTFSTRFGFRPNAAWNMGFSASVGTYLQSSAETTVPPGHSLDDYREIVLGQDLSYAWHLWQFWAEAYEARFEVPLVGNADSLAYYLEAKYKFTPQFFGAVRWNQQIYGTISDGLGGRLQWARAVRRLDIAGGYRFSAHSQLKIQVSLQDDGLGEKSYGTELAAQFVVKF